MPYPSSYPISASQHSPLQCNDPFGDSQFIAPLLRFIGCVSSTPQQLDTSGPAQARSPHLREDFSSLFDEMQPGPLDTSGPVQGMWSPMPEDFSGLFDEMQSGPLDISGSVQAICSPMPEDLSRLINEMPEEQWQALQSLQVGPEQSDASAQTKGWRQLLRYINDDGSLTKKGQKLSQLAGPRRCGDVDFPIILAWTQLRTRMSSKAFEKKYRLAGRVHISSYVNKKTGALLPLGIVRALQEKKGDYLRPMASADIIIGITKKILIGGFNNVDLFKEHGVSPMAVARYLKIQNNVLTILRSTNIQFAKTAKQNNPTFVPELHHALRPLLRRLIDTGPASKRKALQKAYQMLDKSFPEPGLGLERLLRELSNMASS